MPRGGDGGNTNVSAALASNIAPLCKVKAASRNGHAQLLQWILQHPPMVADAYNNRACARQLQAPQQASGTASRHCVVALEELQYICPGRNSIIISRLACACHPWTTTRKRGLLCSSCIPATCQEPLARVALKNVRTRSANIAE